MKLAKYLLPFLVTLTIFFSFVAIPSLVAAAPGDVDLVPCTPGTADFANLCPKDDAEDQIGPIIRNAIIGILVIAAVVALVFLIWGGFKWITSGGDKTKVQEARSTIIAAIIGLIVAFLAYFILSIVLGLFGISLSNLSLPSLTGE